MKPERGIRSVSWVSLMLDRLVEACKRAICNRQDLPAVQARTRCRGWITEGLLVLMHAAVIGGRPSAGVSGFVIRQPGVREQCIRMLSMVAWLSDLMARRIREDMSALLGHAWLGQSELSDATTDAGHARGSRRRRRRACVARCRSASDLKVVARTSSCSVSPCGAPGPRRACIVGAGLVPTSLVGVVPRQLPEMCLGFTHRELHLTR